MIISFFSGQVLNSEKASPVFFHGFMRKRLDTFTEVVFMHISHAYCLLENLKHLQKVAIIMSISPIWKLIGILKNLTLKKIFNLESHVSKLLIQPQSKTFLSVVGKAEIRKKVYCTEKKKKLFIFSLKNDDKMDTHHSLKRKHLPS